MLCLTACWRTPPSLVQNMGTLGAAPVEEIEIPEKDVVLIPLEGPIKASQSELSGLAWFETDAGNLLLLLPQYPERFTGGDEGAIFALNERDIISWLDGKNTESLMPIQIPFYAPGISSKVRGFEGYEAISVNEGRVYLSIESKPGPGMMGYLVSGILEPDLSALRLDVDSLAKIEPQARLSNMTDESIIAAGSSLITLFEAYGANVNKNPVAHRFDLELNPSQDLSFPSIEYRITDATAEDENGIFWVINYFYPGDTKLKPIPDPLVDIYGEGETHLEQVGVERLVALQFTENGIQPVAQPPVYLRLLEDGTARNWEGLVRLGDRGFLLVTDQYPETLFGFIRYDHP